MASVSVVIRAKDEQSGIGETLRRLREQAIPGAEVQVIVVDSGSSDDTVAIARAAGAEVTSIPAGSFTFGGALNHGCALARAPVAVALSAHAFPPDDGWLSRLLAALADERVACASGDRFGPDGRVLLEARSQDERLARSHPAWGYSNAAGAFRLELWRRRPFREDLPGAEDKEWALWWLSRGYVSLVAPDLVVEHDHTKDPLRDIFERSRREWAGLSASGVADAYSIGDLVGEWWAQPGTYTSLTRARLSHRRAARLLGKYAGARGPKDPQRAGDGPAPITGK